jgi:hypothetical protein
MLREVARSFNIRCSRFATVGEASIRFYNCVKGLIHEFLEVPAYGAHRMKGERAVLACDGFVRSFVYSLKGIF